MEPRILSKLASTKIFNTRFIELADSAFFKSAKSEEEKEKLMKCFRFFNSAFPFFLPQAQHNINVPLISVSAGNYWDNAIHFLICNRAHGHPMWKKFQDQMRSMDATDLCKPHISVNTTNRFFKHLKNSAVPVKPAELHGFLLSKEVLLQLPFQPVLLFQWLTATISLVLIFEYEMSEFYNFPFPTKYKSELLSLHELLKSTHRNIGFLFDYLQQHVENENEIFVGHLETFEKFLNEVHVFNRFFYDDSWSNRLKILKAKCWKLCKSHDKLCQMKKGRLPLRNRNFIFNLDFWKSPCWDRKIFGSSYEKLVRKQEDLGAELTYEEIKLFSNTVKKSDFNILIKRAGFMKSAQRFRKLERELKRLNIKLEDQGLIGTIVFNFTAVAAHDARNNLASHVLQALKYPYSKFVDFSVTRREMMNYINIKPFSEMIVSDSFSLREISRELRDRNSHNETKIISETVKKGIEYSVLLQTIRIKQLVLNCIDDQLKMRNYEEEKDEMLKDWQVVQYLLPCFLTSLCDICQLNNPPADKNVKLWYYHFIVKLNEKYISDGVRKSSWTFVSKDIEETPALKDKKLLTNIFDFVTASFDERMRADQRDISKYCPSLKALYEVLTNSMQECPSPDNDLSSEPSNYWNWLMWNFFSNINYAIDAADHKLAKKV